MDLFKAVLVIIFSLTSASAVGANLTFIRIDQDRAYLLMDEADPADFRRGDKVLLSVGGMEVGGKFEHNSRWFSKRMAVLSLTKGDLRKLRKYKGKNLEMKKGALASAE